MAAATKKNPRQILPRLTTDQLIDTDNYIARLRHRIHGSIVVHQNSIPKQESLATWLTLGMLDSIGLTNYSGRIAEKGKGNIELVRERPLLGNRVHGDASHLNLVFRQYRKCRPQRFHLLDSSRRIGFWIKENNRPRTRRGSLHIYLLPKLIRCGYRW